jgi:hypothetical protein
LENHNFFPQAADTARNGIIQARSLHLATRQTHRTVTFRSDGCNSDRFKYHDIQPDELWPGR